MKAGQKIVAVTHPAGERSHDGGEYGFWTEWKVTPSGKQVIRRFRTTCGGFVFCEAHGEFGGIFSDSLSCCGGTHRHAVISREQAAREITRYTGRTGGV